MAANPPPHQQQNGSNQAETGLGSRVSQRQFFEQAWGAHEPDRHPEALRLHVERREADAKVTDLAELWNRRSGNSKGFRRCKKSGFDLMPETGGPTEDDSE